MYMTMESRDQSVKGSKSDPPNQVSSLGAQLPPNLPVDLMNPSVHTHQCELSLVAHPEKQAEFAIILAKLSEMLLPT